MENVFMFISTTLVMLMIPSLALFYGGMVKNKNVISTAMYSYTSLMVVAIQWVLIGYSLTFGPNLGGVIGNLHWFGLRHVGFTPNATYSPQVAQNLFMLFQMMFAALTPAIMSGAFAERMKLSAFIIIVVLWTTLVYDPLAHWVWGDGGWLRNLGALDFAGGTVVHISSGVSGLVIALMIGKRIPSKEEKTSQIALSLLGAGLLWFGWYGFNVGSALSLNSVAMNAFITTTIAAAAASLVWMLCETYKTKKATAVGAANGIVAGLVAITPACGFVSPMISIFIGAIASILCYIAVYVIKERLKYDDTLDAFGLHGVGGIWGAIATGIFASLRVNPAGANGSLHLVGIQLLAILATVIFSALMTFMIVKVVGMFITIRVKKEEEEKGLDKSLIA